MAELASVGSGVRRLMAVLRGWGERQPLEQVTVGRLHF